MVVGTVLFFIAQFSFAQSCECESLVALDSSIASLSYSSVKFGVTVDEETESGKCFVQGELAGNSGTYVRLDVTHERNPTASSSYRCLVHTTDTAQSVGRVMSSNAEAVNCARAVENLAIELLANNVIINPSTGSNMSTGSIRGKCIKAIAGKKF